MPQIPTARKINHIVVASHNSGKITEIADLLQPLQIKVQSALDMGLGDVEETGSTFEENAVLKARTVANACNLPALGDDSGLMVDALGGEPGIYTARWAERSGQPRNWKYAMGKVAQRLKEAKATSWSAKFVCVLALAQPDGQIAVERGEVAGKLVWPIRGNKGFGFDPMFVPIGYEQTFGEMDPAVKHQISHRHMAFEKLLSKHLQ